jgi:heme exporter protein A
VTHVVPSDVPAQSSALFAVNELTCVRQDRCLFESLSFSLNSGEILQIEGPNGAGKSSLLRILAGFLRADSGTLSWQQQAIDEVEFEFLSNLLFIGHKAGINPYLSALENVNFWLKLHGGTHFSTSASKEDVDVFALLGRLGLVGLEDIPVSQLSAGQQRKVALARLWLSQAKLWILDEPFTAIDKKGVSGLQKRFAQHLDAGGMIILTTHQDLTEHFASLQRVHLEYQF